MASLNPLISFTEPITRQDLFDMWDTASFSSVGVDDFADGFMPIIVASSFSSAPGVPQPGQLFWHLTEAVMYCYHDVINDTGVSLWLAIGPDKFETAALAAEPIACGAGVEACGPDRRVQVNRTAGDANIGEVPTVCGFNQSGINAPPYMEPGTTDIDPDKSTFWNTSGDDSGSTYFMGETTPSGSWLRMGIDGIMFMAMAPSSHPTAALVQWTSLGLVSMDTTFDGTVVSTTSGLTPLNNSVGGAIFYMGGTDSGARTEPWWLTKVAFAPRMAADNYFNEA